MTTIGEETINAPVRRSITVNASAQEAFEVFTEDFDSWWPRTHHIGKSPLKRAIVQGRSGGRCYTEQVDGTECDWGTVLAWEPPRRLVLSWQITHEWGYEPERGRCSEVEITFTPLGALSTRVDLEHRHFDRHGPGGASMRASVDSPNGWDGVLQLFVNRLHEKPSGKLS